MQGAPGGIRTPGFRLRRAALYPLSYWRLGPKRSGWAPNSVRTYVLADPFGIVGDMEPLDTRLRGDLPSRGSPRVIEAGLLVLMPFGRFGPYDMLIDMPDGRPCGCR